MLDLDFSFVIPGKLAGMARPGPGPALEATLADLSAEGVGAVVSLTESPLDATALQVAGMQYLHLPVMDFSPPTPAQVERFVLFVDQANAAGRAVVVHCTAGRGRTGTMLACYLVHIGLGAGEAIDSVRRIRPGSIETAEQEDAVRAYDRTRNGA